MFSYKTFYLERLTAIVIGIITKELMLFQSTSQIMSYESFVGGQNYSDVHWLLLQQKSRIIVDFLDQLVIFSNSLIGSNKPHPCLTLSVKLNCYIDHWIVVISRTFTKKVQSYKCAQNHARSLFVVSVCIENQQTKMPNTCIQ